MSVAPFRLVLAASLASLVSVASHEAISQQPTRPADVSGTTGAHVAPSTGARHAITPTDISEWKSIRGAMLSNDGAWFAYTLVPNEGNAEVVVRQTMSGGKELRFPIGEPVGGGSMQLSGDGKWIAFLEFPKEDEQVKLRKDRKPIQSKAVVANLATGEKREYEKVRRVAFAGDSPEWVAMLGYSANGAASGSGGNGGAGAGGGGGGAGSGNGGGSGPIGADMLLHKVGTDVVFNVGNVGDFAFDDKGRWVAYTIDARDGLGNGVQLRDLNSGVVQSVDAGKSIYRRLAWSDTFPAFAFLKGTADSAAMDTSWAVMAMSRVGTPAAKLTQVGGGSNTTIAKGMEVSPDRTPRWMESMDGVLFGTRVATDPVPKELRLADDERPTVMIWHGKDRRLQSMQQVQEAGDKGFSFLAAYWPATNKVVELTDDVVRTGSIAGNDVSLFGYDNSKYERRTNLDGIQRRDFYVVNPRTGEQKLLRKELRSFAQPSPDGRSVLLWDDGDWHVMDVATGKTTNITEGAPVSFIDTEDDHNVDRPATNVVGWAKDGKFVLLNDNWDVWKVGVGGNSWSNVTVNGRKDKIRYSRRISVDQRERGIDLSKPIYMVAMQELTKKEAFVRIDATKPGVVIESGWKDARISPMRARDANVWVSTIQTFSRYPNYWRVNWNGSAGDSIQLTDANPNMNGIAWSPGARLVNYVSEKGDSLQGALYLPAGYEEGKKYPTVVFIYEKLSDGLHQFSSPTFTSSYTPGLHTSRGYAVFEPDIVYKVNDPGMSAVWSVVPAVKAAIATGIVDSANVGLHGHSWGGYQTAFLVGQTDIFKSAVAGAPLTDMISMYSSVYWNSGSSNQPIFQSSQGRFKGNFLENREAYERNSPNRYADKIHTPLLILHDDKDGAVDFNQGITFFNTLRQLDKDVILLEYVGENHGLSQLRNRKDYILRLQDYWDHYLKGQPAAGWLENGVPRLEMDEHLREQKKRLDPPKKG